MLPLKICTPPQLSNLILINHKWSIIEGINPRFFMRNIQLAIQFALLTLAMSIYAYNHACHNLYQINLVYVFQLVKVHMSTIFQFQQVIQFTLDKLIIQIIHNSSYISHIFNQYMQFNHFNQFKNIWQFMLCH